MALHRALSRQNIPKDFGGAGAGTSLAARAERAGRELADLVLQRPRSAPTDPFDNPTPFEQLLGG